MGEDGSGCPTRIGKRAAAFTASFIESRQVVENPSYCWMTRADCLVADRFLANCQRAFVEPFRLTVLALVSMHVGQVGERKGHIGVVRTERIFSDRQRAFVQPLRVAIWSLCPWA